MWFGGHGIGFNESVVKVRIGSGELGEEEGGVRKIARVRKCTKVEELTYSIIVAVETVSDEDGVNGFELVHGGAPLSH